MMGIMTNQGFIGGGLPFYLVEWSTLGLERRRPKLQVQMAGT
jgi:hypothetical protein